MIKDLAMVALRYLGGSGPCLAGTIDELVDNQYEYVNECPNDLQLSLHH